MQGMITTTESSGRRHRHRTRRRKLAEAIGLMFGVPLLLLAVLALSVELIEYHPMDTSIAGNASQATSVESSSHSSVGRVPAAVLEIPPMPTPRESPTLNAEP
jgi:hypothetical protein